MADIQIPLRIEKSLDRFSPLLKREALAHLKGVQSGAFGLRRIRGLLYTHVSTSSRLFFFWQTIHRQKKLAHRLLAIKSRPRLQSN